MRQWLLGCSICLLALNCLPGSAAEIDDAAATLLGDRLFYDARLSANGDTSCATCHKPAQGFTDNTRTTPPGANGKPLRRNAPDLYNVARRPELYWDGRQPDAALQVLEPLVHPDEMANPSVSILVQRLTRTEYNTRFRQVYGELNVANLVDALLRFEKSVVATASPFDRWYFDGFADAVTESAKNGFGIFMRHGCAECHKLDNGLFTDHDFHNTGVAQGAIDLGRYEATGKHVDRYRFRTPSLRNVALTSPYMHDGSENSLTDVIRFYMRGPASSESGMAINAGVDERLLPFVLDQTEVSELIDFLNSLTSKYE